MSERYKMTKRGKVAIGLTAAVASAVAVPPAVELARDNTQIILDNNKNLHPPVADELSQRYVVKPGDTAWKIVKQYDFGDRDIRSVIPVITEQQHEKQLQIGEELHLPADWQPKPEDNSR